MSSSDYAETDMISENDATETRSRTEVELWDHITALLAAPTHRRVMAALPPELSRPELRATIPLTQEELARRLGLTQPRVSRIERHPDPHARFDKGDFRVT